MSTTSAGFLPQSLTPQQAQEMAQRQIKKHQVAVVLLHWFNALVWLLELATGAALVVSPSLRFAPQWYLTFMEQLFGSPANLLRFHIAVGITWILVCAVYVDLWLAALLACRGARPKKSHWTLTISPG